MTLLVPTTAETSQHVTFDQLVSGEGFPPLPELPRRTGPRHARRPRTVAERLRAFVAGLA